MTPIKQSCSCGTVLINEHGLRGQRFVKINTDNSCEAKCKGCGEMVPVPLKYELPKT